MSSTTTPTRKLPNIVITGTPGVGKTSHAEALALRGAGADGDGALAGLRHLSVNRVVKERGCHEGWDEERGCWIVDEDKLLDAIEDEVKAGGCVIDWHACDLFPESWIDLVVVLRAESDVLYDRLTERKYPEAKLQENLDAEIMEVLLQEAREAYAPEIVVELASNSPEDMEANVDRIEAWWRQWLADNNGGERAGTS